MINLYTNLESYQYDLYAIIKAFYPVHEINMPVCSSNNGRADRNADENANVPAMENKIEARFLPNGIEALFDVGERKAYSVEMDDCATKRERVNAFYKMMRDYTKKSLPWGCLTGVRPTKLMMGMLENGMDRDDIANAMMEKYSVSPAKAQLGIDIAERERQLLNATHGRDGYSLYIGIPFCPTTCLYCSFTSFPIGVWGKRTGEYLDALFREMDFAADALREKPLDTVYIGGGTPTTLSADGLDMLFSRAWEKFDLKNALEITVEAGRADSITPEKLGILKKHKVTRISVNPQTMNDKTLKLIGRQHTAEQARAAFALARDEGFDNINMDIILGLPGECESDVKYTIDEIVKLNPDSLTVHSLAIKRASKLSRWIEENGIDEMKNTEIIMEIARAGAAALGMKPYYLYRQKNISGNFENVGYAKEGKYGIYNILINEEKQTIVALGAGGISKRVYEDGNIERSENLKDAGQYIERIGEMVERKRRILPCPSNAVIC